jgi:DNA polymerase sigma
MIFQVPVLMATDDNDVSMDITVQNECFSSDRTAQWIKEYPALKPIFMILKQVIGNYRITNFPSFEPLSAKTAGLASYALICMIVSYVQVRNLHYS